MAATSAYILFTNLFPVYLHFLQSLTKLLLYIKKYMKYFTNQQNIRKTEFHFPYQQHHARETAKDVAMCRGIHFYRTQLMAVNNTIDESKMLVCPPTHPRGRGGALKRSFRQ